MEATPHHEFSALYTSESQLTRALAAKFHHNRQATERYFFSQLTLIATSRVRRRNGGHALPTMAGVDLHAAIPLYAHHSTHLACVS